ncbi:MAG: AraC family transcriptional regulator [Planctomycetota bacterium]|jgi:YesN/AraC family two-component response regulator
MDSVESILLTLNTLLDNFRFLPEEILILKSENRRKVKLERNLHIHSDWELKALVNGTHKFKTRTKTYTLKAPSLVLIEPGAIHYIDKYLNNSNCCIFNCTFDLSDLSVGYYSNINNSFYSILQQDLKTIENLLSVSISSYLENIIDLITDENSISTHEAAGKLRLFFTAVGRILDNENNDLNYNETSIVDKCKAIMQARYSDYTLSIAEISKQLLTHFQTDTNSTIRQYLITLRLNKAKQFLKSKKYSVKEIAWMTGWKTAFHFSNSFKKHFGYRPSEI